MKGDVLNAYSHFTTIKEYDLPSILQAVIDCDRGFANLKVVRAPIPQINSNQILARVDAAGVCTRLLKLVDPGPDHTFVRDWNMVKWPVIHGDKGAETR